MLVDALLVDLATLQAAILKDPWKPLMSGSLIPDALRQLKALAEHPFELLSGDAAQPDVKIAARLAAGIEFLGRTSSRWYESRVFPWGLFRRGPVLRREILAQQRQLVKNLFGEPDAAKQALLNDLVEQYYQRLAAVREKVRLEKRKAARQVLLAPLETHQIVTDIGQPFPAVVSFSEWTAIEQAERQREASRSQLQDRKESDRTTYGVARDGLPQPDVAPQVRSALQAFTDACTQARAALHTQAHDKRRRADRLPHAPDRHNIRSESTAADRPMLRDEA